VLPITFEGNIFLIGKTMIENSKQFGALIQRHRQALELTQEELGLTANVGPRFIVELEAGKPTCQLGKALAVARAVGVKLVDAADPPPEATPSRRTRAPKARAK
jgi:HTH-type transcriptional regulator/antitoxin HipB